MPGAYDRVELVLAALGMPFTRLGPAELARARLRPAQLVVLNCPAQLPREALGRVRAFVEGGGSLFTTDWALQHVIEPAFPGLLAYNGRPTRDDVVRIERRGGANPFLRGVLEDGDDPVWWLEGSSYPIRVCDPGRVEVLLASAELAQRYGEQAVAVLFRWGEGEVFHMISHSYDDSAPSSAGRATRRRPRPMPPRRAWPRPPTSRAWPSARSSRRPPPRASSPTWSRPKSAAADPLSSSANAGPRILPSQWASSTARDDSMQPIPSNRSPKARLCLTHTLEFTSRRLPRRPRTSCNTVGGECAPSTPSEEGDRSGSSPLREGRLARRVSAEGLLQDQVPLSGEAHEVGSPDTLGSELCEERSRLAPALLLLEGGGMKFAVRFEGVVVSAASRQSPADLESHLDDVMDELLEAKAPDAAVSANGSTGQVEISVTVDAETLEEAVARGNALIRSAIHAAGGMTPDWSIDWLSATAQKAHLVKA